MENAHKIAGVYAAAVTPLLPNLAPDLDGLEQLIHFLANRGCHGILLLGTTGEGPSFSSRERGKILQVGVTARQNMPDLQLLAGTGTPSIEETVKNTRKALDLGYDGVVVLPPYYYRKATDEGLFAWYSQVINQAVPAGGHLLGYHIPSLTGINLSLNLCARLLDAYPGKFVGIKDSSGDPDWSRLLGDKFGSDLTVMNGNDRLFSLALKSKASGCITALANLLSPLHRKIWESYMDGNADDITQEKLTSARELLDRYPPMPPSIKVLFSRLHGFPHWRVKPPLLDFDPALADILLSEFLATVE